MILPRLRIYWLWAEFWNKGSQLDLHLELVNFQWEGASQSRAARFHES